MPPTSRAERRRDIERRVVEVGRRHLASEGAAGLSLRAVTRELGMVSSAVYRYVANRDELLTLLLVDAYGELADAVDEAVAAAADQRWDERIVVAGAAFRAWAVADPASYALLYGSPVPGYEAPAERTVEPGTRVTLTLLRLLAEGVEAGDVAPTGPAPVGDRRLGADLERLVAETGLPGGADVMGRALLLWATLVGGTSLEVFGQYGRDTLTAPGALLEHQLRLALAVVRSG